MTESPPGRQGGGGSRVKVAAENKSKTPERAKAKGDVGAESYFGRAAGARVRRAENAYRMEEGGARARATEGGREWPQLPVATAVKGRTALSTCITWLVLLSPPASALSIRIISPTPLCHPLGPQRGLFLFFDLLAPLLCHIPQLSRSWETPSSQRIRGSHQESITHTLQRWATTECTRILTHKIYSRFFGKVTTRSCSAHCRSLEF